MIMKKGLKSLLIFVAFSLMILPLIGVASAAEINYARSSLGYATRSVTRSSPGADGVVQTGLESYVNDGSLSTSCSQYSHDGGYAQVDARLTFSTPINYINRFEYRVRGSRTTSNFYVRYAGSTTWNVLKTDTAPYGQTRDFTVPGPFYNVNGIRLYVRSDSDNEPYNEPYGVGIHEMEALGPVCGDSDCDVGEDYSNCPEDCGKFCSSDNDIIMKLFSPNNSHGAMWDYGGSTTLEGCNPDSGTNADCQSCGQIFDYKPIQAWTYFNSPPSTPGCYNGDDGVLNSTAYYCDEKLGQGNFGCAANRFILVDNFPNPSSAGWYVCPSYRRNGNIPVTASDCICYDVNYNHCANPPVTYNDVFNFSNEFFAGPYYTYEICYSDFFDDGYEDLGLSEQEYHPDTCSNPILWLYQHNNSHAENPNINNYPYPVCYGDLGCYDINVSAGESCGLDEKIVVSLYQKTNSHISNASDSDYPIKICCKRGEITPSTERSWQNMKGKEITDSDIGDTVLMVYSGVSQTYDFDIWEDDVTFGFPHDDKIKTSVSSFLENQKAIAKWIIDPDNFENPTDDYEDFFFKVDNDDSPYLNVFEHNYDNSVPKAKIIKPIEGNNYIIRSATGKTETIDFIQQVEDEDDDLKVLWDFDDKTNSGWLENCLTTGNCNTNHDYDEPGTKDIILYAQEMTRKQTATNTSKINIYKQGLNVFVILEKKVSGKTVLLNATKSFVADCYNDSNDCDTAHTNADLTGNATTDCREINDSDNNFIKLYCYNRDIRYDRPGVTNINAVLIFNINGVEFQPQEVDYLIFFSAFDKPGEHIIELNLAYKKS